MCVWEKPFDFFNDDNKPYLCTGCFPRPATNPHTPKRPAHPALVPLPPPLPRSLLPARIAHRHPLYVQIPLCAGAKHPVLVHENKDTSPPKLAFPRTISPVGKKPGGLVS